MSNKTSPSWTPLELVEVQSLVQPAFQYVQNNPSSLLLLLFLPIIFWTYRNPSSKGKIATSYWAGSKEKAACRRTALQQIKQPKKNNYSLYVNPPRLIRSRDYGLFEELPQRYRAKTGSAPTYYFPFGQQSVAIAGKAGSGKTFGMIDPALMSAIDQGLTVICYDFKYPGQAELAIYARRRGYQVFIYAPGRPESCIFNPLDLIRSSKDGLKAKDLVQVMVANSHKSDGGDGGNEFFVKGGAAIVEATFLLAKWIAEFTGADYLGDLLTASIIANLPNLPARIMAINTPASIRSRLDYAAGDGQPFFSAPVNADMAIVSAWVTVSFSQLISASGGGEDGGNVTAGGLLANAQGTFESFIRSDLIGSFCRDKSISHEVNTLPIDLDGKTLVVFGLDQDNRESIAPLIATGLHALISHNVSPARSRKTGLVVGMDEFPTLNLPSIVRYPAEARSMGFCLLAGFQNYSQIVQTYGENNAKTIIGSCATKVLFDPGEYASAEIFSKILGDIDVEISQKSTSYSSGNGQGSTSRSTSQVIQQKALFAPSEFLKLPRGEAVVISPGYASRKESNIPLRIRFKVAPALVKERQYCSDKWQPWIAAMQRAAPKLSESEIDEMMRVRQQLVENLFPEPVTDEDEA